MPSPIAYADRLTNRTLCPSCAFTRIDMASSEESGPIMRYDLDPDDTCTCDVCGTACAPDNVTGETYIIGSNMPGYMPDSEPFTVVGTFDDAKAALLDTLESEANSVMGGCGHDDPDDDCEECELMRDIEDAIAEVKDWDDSGDSVSVGNYVYWIATN